MRNLLAAVALAAFAAPASAEVDANMMDLSLGLWMLSAGDGAFCPLTLGDEPMDADARRLDGGSDCAEIDPAMANATAWRIDMPGELVILNDKGKMLLKLQFNEPNGSFHTAGRNPELSLEPSE